MTTQLRFEAQSCTPAPSREWLAHHRLLQRGRRVRTSRRDSAPSGAWRGHRRWSTSVDSIDCGARPILGATGSRCFVLVRALAFTESCSQPRVQGVAHPLVQCVSAAMELILGQTLGKIGVALCECSERGRTFRQKTTDVTHLGQRLSVSARDEVCL